MTRHEPEGGAKGVSEWFPAKERGRVVGIHTAGASPGATIAPRAIAFLVSHFGWRAVFLFTGSHGGGAHHSRR